MTLSERLYLVRIALNADSAILAERAGIGQQELLTYESGDAQPAQEILGVLADELAMDFEFFLRDTPLLDITPASPRISTMGDFELEILLAQARLWLERYLDVESFVESDEVPAVGLPEGFPYAVDSAADAAQAAEDLREGWRLGDAPIKHMADLLDDMGIRVGLVRVPGDFDASTFRTDDAFGWPLIVVQQDLPGDEQRFAMARELGHLVLQAPDPQMAMHFAAAFLTPANALRRDLGSNRTALDPVELSFLKHKYGISLRRLIPRATSLRIVGKEVHDEWSAAGREEGWDELEAESGLYPSETPQRIIRLAQRIQAEELVSEERGDALLDMPWLE